VTPLAVSAVTQRPRGRRLSIGVYGFLSRAHIEHVLAGDLPVSRQTAEVDARISDRPLW
jgi:hypothetical protein